MINKGYHVTKAYNLQGIQEKGIEPKTGTRSEYTRDKLKFKEEERPVVCFVDNIETALRWAGGNLKKTSDESEHLVILSFSLAGTKEITKRPLEYGTEYILTNCGIPPESINLVKLDENNRFVSEKRLQEIVVPKYSEEFLREKNQKEKQKWQKYYNEPRREI